MDDLANLTGTMPMFYAYWNSVPLDRQQLRSEKRMFNMAAQIADL